MYTHIEDALATYHTLIADGDVTSLDALRSVQEDCDEQTAEDLEVAVLG